MRSRNFSRVAILLITVVVAIPALVSLGMQNKSCIPCQPCEPVNEEQVFEWLKNSIPDKDVPLFLERYKAHYYDQLDPDGDPVAFAQAQYIDPQDPSFYQDTKFEQYDVKAGKSMVREEPDKEIPVDLDQIHAQKTSNDPDQNEGPRKNDAHQMVARDIPRVSEKKNAPTENLKPQQKDSRSAGDHVLASSRNAEGKKFKPWSWKRHTRSVCQSLGFSPNQSELTPPLLSKVLVDDRHQLLYCQMAKVASTNLGKIFAIIAGKFNGTNPDEIDSNSVHWLYNKLEVHLDAFPMKELLYKINHYYKFVFVRDPFERLLSGYRNKFLKPASNYFAYLNDRLILKYRKKKSGGPKAVTFTEFVTYLLDKERQVPMNAHWQPMYDLCRPCQVNYNYVGKLSTFADDVRTILEENNLTNVVQIPRSSRGHTFHKTDLYLKDFYSQLPKPLLLELYEMYYPDYAIFNFTLPDVIQQMMK